ncbi:MAG TPA: hypothetical protein DCS89_18255 [Gammaproteobacteria bacterium]|jgi:hypothetical protein|nr:hypothetical protein [Gammaproteobacteria bacterium]HAT28964.1 hypothetical protein [Gammaproteobacteria bacterium]|tara:strand:- start:1698 stop:2363 length:666 start_codon:yes stop_codon:yes gene_type:complete
MWKITILLVVSFSLCNLSIVYADVEWRLRKDEDNIQVYSRKVDGSPFDAVRTVTVMQDVRLSALAALIIDANACANWASRCMESYIFRRLNDTEAYVYTHSNMPFPIKNRDMLTHAIWSQDATSLTVRVDSEATTEILDDIAGRLRLTQVKLGWIFRPLESGAVEISNEAHIDPGSNLPGWISNLLLLSTPYETMRSFVLEVAKPEYRDAVVSFVREPPAR